MHGFCTFNFKNGNIAKGDMKFGKRDGTWNMYREANDDRLCGYWCKEDFVDGVKTKSEYDLNYNKGFQKTKL